MVAANDKDLSACSLNIVVSALLGRVGNPRATARDILIRRYAWEHLRERRIAFAIRLVHPAYVKAGGFQLGAIPNAFARPPSKKGKAYTSEVPRLQLQSWSLLPKAHGGFQ
jgi:hypothetical protein